MTSPTRDLTLHLRETRSGNALLEAARDLDKAAAGADKFGDSIKGATHDAANLEHAIAKTKTQIKDLNVQFARTGDKGLFGDIRKQEAHLRNLEKVLKEVRTIGAGDVDPGLTAKFAVSGRKAGYGFGDAFVGAIEKRMFGVPGPIIAGLVVAVAAALPAIGAMLAGAVTGTVGLGGIAGGIAAAGKDAHVKKAASDFSDSISSQFFGSGSAFVMPIVKSLDILDEAFRDLHLEDAFATVAPYVKAVAEGVAGLGREFMPGFNRALKAAGPALQIFAQELPAIGHALGFMFQRLAESEGTLEGFRFFLRAVSATLQGLGTILSWLGDRFHEMLGVIATVTGALENLPGPFRDEFANANDIVEEFIASSQAAAFTVPPLSDAFVELGSAGDGAGDSVKGLNNELKGAQDALESFVVTANELVPATFSWARAQDDATTSVRNLKEQLKEQREEGVKGAGSLKGNTEAAINNRNAVRDLVAEYGEMITKAAESGEKTGNLKKELKDLLIQMGLNKTDVQFYVDQLDRIPVEKITKIRIEKEEATRRIQETERELDRARNLARFDIEIGGKKKRDLVTQETARELTRLRHLAEFDVIVHNAQARAAIAETRRELARLKDKTITINVLRTTLRTGQTGNFAEGGWTPGGGQAFVVGEKGPEIMSTEKPMYVTPNAGAAANPSPIGGNTYTINVGVAPGGDMRAAGDYVVRAIQTYEASNGTRWRR